MNNLIDYNQFRTKGASVSESSRAINENVIAMDDCYRVQSFVDIPKSLVTAFLNKIKNETGKKAGELYSETQIAELISSYVSTNFLNVENLPVDIAMGTTKTPVQTQAQTVAQTQPAQTLVQEPVAQTPADETQPVAQVPPAQGAQTPAQTPAQAPTTPQAVASQVPAQEI